MQNQNFTIKNWKRDRRGFTLVELMIAITVLAMVTIPIVSYFGNANIKNAESRTRQNAAVQAQDILEGFKNATYSLDDSSVVCNNDTSTTKWTVKVPADPTSGNDKYTLQKEVKIDNSRFTVEADIDPIQKVVKSPTDSTTVIDYERAIVGTMDTYKDVLISENGQSLLAAKLFFYGRHADAAAANNMLPALTMEDIQKNLGCKISIKGTEEKNALGLSTGNVIVEAKFQYEYIGSPYPDGIDATTVYTEPVKVSSLDPKEMTNIYLFYQPATAAGISSMDTVELDADTFFGDTNNIENNQLNLYIVAQSSVSYNSSEVPDGYVKRKPGYKLELKDVSSGSNFKTKIGKVYTNLSFNDSELFATGFGSDQLATNVDGSEYTLVNQEKMNRVADITVRIIKDGKTYATVNGAKVQN